MELKLGEMICESRNTGHILSFTGAYPAKRIALSFALLGGDYDLAPFLEIKSISAVYWRDSPTSKIIQGNKKTGYILRSAGTYLVRATGSI